jgi:5-methylcytosine-specific restriction endonuclease McrA
MYCSKQCKRMSWMRRHGHDVALEQRRAARLAKKLQRFADALFSRLLKEAQRERAELERRRATCAFCRSSFLRTMGRVWTCSDSCSIALAKLSKRREKQRRRAVKRQALIVPFADLEIFQRDRWRCYLCNCKTPARLLGSNDDAAPTIDHVIALANGGAHAPFNVRCCCRACNAIKSWKGQLCLI